MKEHGKQRIIRRILLVLLVIVMAAGFGIISSERDASAAKEKNSVKASKTSVRCQKTNSIIVNKAKKEYKLTVKVTGTAKNYITVKYGGTILVKDGKTTSKGAKKKIKKDFEFRLTAVANDSNAMGKTYKIVIGFINVKTNKIVATKETKKVTVEKTTIKSVTLEETNKTVKIGATFSLKTKVDPKKHPFKTTWKSEDSSVATVDRNGLVVAVAKGSTKIVASVDGKTAKCVVTVIESKVKLTLTKLSDCKYYVAQPATDLVVRVESYDPMDAGKASSGRITYQWYSSDKEPTPDEDGNISTEGCTLIVGARSERYMPDTKEKGTTYYFCRVDYESKKKDLYDDTFATTNVAKIEIEPITVTFDANGGTPATTTKEVNYNTAIGNLPKDTEVKQANKVLLGWATTAKATSPDVTSDTKVKEPTTFYAVWKEEPSEPQQRVWINRPDKLYVKANSSIYLGAEFDGFDFSTGTGVPFYHWYLKTTENGAYTEDTTKSGTGNVGYDGTIETAPIWFRVTMEVGGKTATSKDVCVIPLSDTGIQGEVVLNLNGGEFDDADRVKIEKMGYMSGDSSNSTYYKLYPTTEGTPTLSMPTNLKAKDGKAFLGWYTDQADGEQVTSSTPLNFTDSNKTFNLYARWQA